MTTTSIDRARTGTRTSFSVGEMKVKKRSGCTTTTNRRLKFDDALWDSDFFFINFFERCIKPYRRIFFSFDFFKTKRTELFEVCSGSNGQVGVFVGQSLYSRKQIFLPCRTSQDLTNKFISSIVI